MNERMNCRFQNSSEYADEATDYLFSFLSFWLSNIFKSKYREYIKFEERKTLLFRTETLLRQFLMTLYFFSFRFLCVFFFVCFVFYWPQLFLLLYTSSITRALSSIPISNSKKLVGLCDNGPTIPIGCWAELNVLVSKKKTMYTHNSTVDSSYYIQRALDGLALRPSVNAYIMQTALDVYTNTEPQQCC